MPLIRPSRSAATRGRARAGGKPDRGTAALSAAAGFALLLTPAAVTAQEGTITYTHVVKREMAAGGGGQRGGPPGFRGGQQFTPPPRTATVAVHFSPSHWLMVPPQRGPGRGEGGGQRVRAGGDADRPRGDGGGGGFGRWGRGGFGWGATGSDPYAATELRAAFVDPEAGTMVEARRFLGRTFRVTRERPSLEWQLTSEQAEHLGYMVIKATAQQDSATTIEAWFTPQIPVFGGPASYGGLPGMILVLSVNDGQIQYQATEVLLGELEEGLITPPDEGDEISQEEFERIVKERLEEMARMRRPPGGDERR